MKRWRSVVSLITSMLLLSALSAQAAFAQTYTSTNYQTNEVFFGSGGELNQTSTNYGAQSSVGELGVGNSTSTNYQTHAGFNTTQQPFLSFVVTSSNIDLGYLNTSSVTTATGNFSVEAWDSGGYNIANASPPPTNTLSPFHVLTALASPTASAPGTEQFGINLVANTSPSVGAAATSCPNSNQCPDLSGNFPVGAAATGYNTTNQFKYVNGGTIATSSTSTSATAFTISYIFNISSATTAGKYNFTHILVATATY